jgi:hypothetical protein
MYVTRYGVRIMSEAFAYLTLGQVAEQLGCQLWQVQRVVDCGLVPPPIRLGRLRGVPRGQLGEYRRALKEQGFLKG